MGDEGLGRVKTGDDGKEGYKKLVVWKNAKELRALVHRLTGEFPKLEVRRISQMRDAARSVKQNIQEGYQRRTRGEYLRGLEIAKGSLAELQGDVEDCLEDGVGYRTQLLTDKTPNAAPLGVRMKAWYPGPHGVPADQPCGLRVEVPSRLGPEVPEGGAQRAGGPAVEDGVPRDRRTLRVHGGARSDAGSRPRVRLGTPALESRRAGQGAEERLGETALRRVPPAPRVAVGVGTSDP